MDERKWLLSKRNPDRLTPGSIVRVERILGVDNPKPLIYTGTVIAIYRKGVGSSFRIINKVNDEMIEFGFQIYSPLIKKIEILKPGNEKRSKLFYLRDEKRCPVVGEHVDIKEVNRPEKVFVPKPSFNDNIPTKK